MAWSCNLPHSLFPPYCSYCGILFGMESSNGQAGLLFLYSSHTMACTVGGRYFSTPRLFSTGVESGFGFHGCIGRTFLCLLQMHLCLSMLMIGVYAPVCHVLYGAAISYCAFPKLLLSREACCHACDDLTPSSTPKQGLHLCMMRSWLFTDDHGSQTILLRATISISSYI